MVIQYKQTRIKHFLTETIKRMSEKLGYKVIDGLDEQAIDGRYNDMDCDSICSNQKRASRIFDRRYQTSAKSS